MAEKMGQGDRIIEAASTTSLTQLVSGTLGKYSPFVETRQYPLMKGGRVQEQPGFSGSGQLYPIWVEDPVKVGKGIEHALMGVIGSDDKASQFYTLRLIEQQEVPLTQKPYHLPKWQNNGSNHHGPSTVVERTEHIQPSHKAFLELGIVPATIQDVPLFHTISVAEVASLNLDPRVKSLCNNRTRIEVSGGKAYVLAGDVKKELDSAAQDALAVLLKGSLEGKVITLLPIDKNAESKLEQERQQRDSKAQRVKDFASLYLEFPGPHVAANRDEWLVQLSPDDVRRLSPEDRQRRGVILYTQRAEAELKQRVSEQHEMTIRQRAEAELKTSKAQVEADKKAALVKHLIEKAASEPEAMTRMLVNMLQDYLNQQSLTALEELLRHG